MKLLNKILNVALVGSLSISFFACSDDTSKVNEKQPIVNLDFQNQVLELNAGNQFVYSNVRIFNYLSKKKTAGNDNVNNIENWASSGMPNACFTINEVAVDSLHDTTPRFVPPHQVVNDNYTEITFAIAPGYYDILLNMDVDDADYIEEPNEVGFIIFSLSGATPPRTDIFLFHQKNNQ
ncbi:hypothetical protein IT568_11655 [bacterium]|nr:hypothetical protein [bacterium]